MTDNNTVPQNVSGKQLIAFFAMVVGMFMAVLDIQIVASSLSVIAAGLSASNEELSWVQTSYLISEVIIIPITGFAARTLSTRISYFVAALGFTIMSALCAVAWSIESIVIFRAFQGFFGGAMIPTVFGITYIIFPPEKRASINVLIGLVVTVAPTLGPTLGGYITDIMSWHFMFLLNVVPGIFVCVAVFLYADFDKPDYSLLKNFDYIGIITLTIALGSLQYVLEEGSKKSWFEDNVILFLSIAAAIGFIVLIARELTFVNPILDLSAFVDKNFTFGCIYSFILGIGLYGAVYILPLFLFTIPNFNTIDIGFTMMVTGIAQFLAAPVAGRLSTSGIDLRVMQAFGFGLFSFGCYLNSFLTADSKYWEFFMPQFVRGFSMMFCFIPNNNMALSTIGRHKVQNASGLFNLMRNLGGAIGLAVINTCMNSDSDIFTQYLGENIYSTSQYAMEQMQMFSSLLDGKVFDPEKASYLILQNNLSRDAFIIATNHIFLAIGIAFFSSIILLPFTSNVKFTGAAEGAH